MLHTETAAKRNVTLYTSLPKTIKRIAGGHDVSAVYQRACITSWQRLGFDVVSLNTRSEIDALSEFDYNVTFHEVDSARPRIVDFFKVIQNSRKPVAGIINADCLLLGNEAIIASVLKAAENGLVMLERMNLRAEDVRITGISCYGFDFFCFSAEKLHPLELDPEMTIGTPWWDYLFPLSFKRAGGTLFLVSAPLLIHIDHPQNWSRESWLYQGRKVHAALARHSADATLLPFARYGLSEELSHIEIDSLAAETFQWLKESANPVEVKDLSGSLLLSFLAGIDQVPKALLERDRMLRERDEKIRAIEDSLGWKIIGTLHGIAKRLGFRKAFGEN